MISQYFENKTKKNYRNIIDAIRFSEKMKLFSGYSVFTVENDSSNGIIYKFSLLGFVFYIVWLLVYFSLSYISFCRDQTILRALYNTKLKHYGDVYERVASVTYVIYAMWKIPFKMRLNHGCIRQILEIDKAIEKIGMPIDHGKSARVVFAAVMIQLFVNSARFLTVWITLKNLETDIHFQVLVKLALYDAVVMIAMSHYYVYLIFLKDRYNMINKLLGDIKERKAWQYTVLTRRKMYTVETADELQDNHACEKIKACARIYSLLYKAHKVAMSVFGFTVLLTMLFCQLYIILYLFYLMEATASGLFHDTRRYIYYLVYIFWQIAFALGVIFLLIYFSEETVKEVSFIIIRKTKSK